MRPMFSSSERPPELDHDRLLHVIRSVRNRWRARVVLRGLLVMAAVGIVVFLVSAYAMDRLRFAPTAVVIIRVLAYGAVVAAAARYLVLPLARRVPDERVALYLEEQEPALDGQVSSAVEFGGRVGASTLVRRLVEGAYEACAAIEFGKRVEQPRLARFSGALLGVTLVSAAVLLTRPGFVGTSAPFLLAPWAVAGAGNPYGIDVTPGDSAVPRGADLKVGATLRNFEAEKVELALRRGDADRWERWPMTVDDESGEYAFVLFDLREQTEYFVAAGGVRSALYRIEVREVPYVERLDLEYHFPAYTGLSPRRQENSGDIAAVAGTRVDLTVTATLPVEAGAIIVAERDTIALDPTAAGPLGGSLSVERPGLYRIVLRGADGSWVVGSPDYYIDVLDDQPPSVAFAKPGRDISVTSIDEVFVSVEAEDDFGVAKLELLFAVNGGSEQRLLLSEGGGRRQLTAGHTFYLEELDLVPGDVIAYFARASDANAVSGAQTAATDLYFVEIRPFDRRFRQAEAQGGGAGGGEGGDVGELSRRQRQVIAATFKVVRDSASLTDAERREHLTTLALAQGRLRDEVETLVGRIEGRRVVDLDSTFRSVADALPRAVEAMGTAETWLGEGRPRKALSPEQLALRFLQRAEAAFRERQVSRGGGGAGGGGGEASAEELADLFDLELDKLRNQYEQVDRGDRQAAEQQIDEVLEKLRELARRQQQENERRRAQAQQQGGGAGGGSAQRRLAEQAEEAARQLERLSRDRSRPELAETARRIREAVDAMRRAAATERSGDAAQGQSALDRLREARRLLEQNRSADLERDVQDALRRAERLADEQGDVVRDVVRLGVNDARRGERLQRLIERKDAMAGEVRDLESELTRLSRDARGSQPDAARKLDEAARGMRDTRLADKILYSRGVVQGRSPDYARNLEEQIASDLGELTARLREALDAMGETREQRLARSLDRARDMVNALESLEERLRARIDRPEAGQDRRLRAGDSPPAPGEPRDSAAQEGAPGPPRADQSRRGGGPPQSGERGQLSPDDARQFRREIAERRGELEELRRELQREDVGVQPLDDILRGLRALENRGPLGEPRGLAALEGEIIAGLKAFEYALRRQLVGGDRDQLFLSGSDEVPPEYRQLVEEYYRLLSRGRR